MYRLGGLRSRRGPTRPLHGLPLSGAVPGGAAQFEREAVAEVELEGTDHLSTLRAAARIVAHRLQEAISRYVTTTMVFSSPRSP